MFKMYNKNYLPFLLTFTFLIIYISPIIVFYLKSVPDNYVISIYNGSINFPSRLPQYFPILIEFIESGFNFENSVNNLNKSFNIENIRISPFLIASFPSIFSNNLNFIIISNYVLSFILNIAILFLISREFLKDNFYSVIAALLTYFFFNILTFNPLGILSNIFLNPFVYKLNYSSISSDIEIIFQSLSNFLLLSFFYIMIKLRKNYRISIFLILLIFFILNAFSYQSHFIISYAIFTLILLFDLIKKKITLKQFIIFNFIILVSFIFFLFFHYKIIGNSSWSSEEFIKSNLFYDFLSGFSFLSFLRFFLNSYFLLFLVASFFYLSNKNNNIILYSASLLGMILSLIYFSSDLFIMELQRIIFRGVNIIITPLIFIYFLKTFVNSNLKFLRIISKMSVFILFLFTILKFTALTHYNFTSNAGLMNKDRKDLYDYISKNFPKNTVLASFDHVDWELLPVYTDSDLFFSSIFNSYKRPEEEISKYIFLSKEVFGKNITFEYIKNLKIHRKNYKENFKMIRETFNMGNKKLSVSEKVFDTWLFSRNMLGFTVYDDNLFEKFNNKKIPKNNYQKFYIAQVKELEKKNNFYKLPELIIINKKKNNHLQSGSYKKKYENDNFIIYKLSYF